MGPGLTVSVAVFGVPAPIWPEIVTGVKTVTADVVIVAKLEVVPPAIVRVGWTVAEGSLLERLTTTPEGPATPVRATVTLLVAEPPITEIGFTDTELMTAGFTTRTVVTGVPAPIWPDRVTFVGESTPEVVTWTDPVYDPDPITTVAGTLAAPGVSLERFTVTPLGPAGPVRVTTRLHEDVPPITGFGVAPSEWMLVGLTVSEAPMDVP
jgi:hypothetical protein